MTSTEKRLLLLVFAYMAVFLLAVVAIDGLPWRVDVYVMLAIAGGVVATVAVAVEVRHTRRDIEDKGEDFQRTVRDLDDALSGRDAR